LVSRGRVSRACEPSVPGGEGATELVQRFRSHSVQLHDLGLADLGELLEPCVPGDTLKATVNEDDQDVIVAGLLRRLWDHPTDGQPFRPLQDMCDYWADEFEIKLAARPGQLDAGLARAGIELFRELPESTSRQALLCTDLHGGNILAAQREPWLVIDPKPYVGDPAYDPLQHMLNCPSRLASDPHGFADRMAGLMDLDAKRVRLWLFARCVQESLNMGDPPWSGIVDLPDVAARLRP
jgi:streptomycin 6-kinase